MPVKKIGVLISGSGTNLQSLIDEIRKENINGEIAVVVSNKDNAYGLERSKLNNIDAVFVDEKKYNSFELFNEAIITELKSRDIDLVVLAGYIKILSGKFIAEFKNNIINIHPSLIPSFCGKGYYGIKVHQAAIDYGVKISGATVHFVDEGADTGPIIFQEAVSVSDSDTAETLQKKVLLSEHRLLPLAVKMYCEDRLRVEGRRVVIR
ncbi:phosphoribosylglycinamide formyltransferase [Sedimentibacter hydroxybenzoicus DSM 7310]|uniref:Phosphoribosylglycinamide formyltransferase n=1 Tax=Sedimentibacter hydroxybenzoicus DSM 7310 TaxID=1123245 RepID=A0A974BKD0_SEDHY|nr:phosphoribosylglycinamide formyltransferase [Sedimentibacter hydroxybenzoicus]NYB74909.1 phosphoribosylglycinamide formyltransferase [Sedimentibacter hydroxybenzoicus DSM 7310]